MTGLIQAMGQALQIGFSTTGLGMTATNQPNR
jgi:hypothetical protein